MNFHSCQSLQFATAKKSPEEQTNELGVTHLTHHQPNYQPSSSCQVFVAADNLRGKKISA